MAVCDVNKVVKRGKGMAKRVVAAVELTEDGIKRIVMVAKTHEEMAQAHRMLARATPALRQLETAIKGREPVGKPSG